LLQQLYCLRVLLLLLVVVQWKKLLRLWHPRQ
jgi:hypothetical protein